MLKYSYKENSICLVGFTIEFYHILPIVTNFTQIIKFNMKANPPNSSCEASITLKSESNIATIKEKVTGVSHP